MISIGFVFWMFVVLGAIIGTLRGWAKELLVSFSVILAIFIITVLETYIGFIAGFYETGGPVTIFWTRTTIILLMAFFGYQTPNIKLLAKGAVRDKLQDSLLGFVLGGINGYLIIGSIWAYMHWTNYPFSFVISPESPQVQSVLDPTAVESTLQLIKYLPPVWLTAPGIYFAVAVAFTFVVIVFI
ncbi:MAG: hypothetical protein FVQ83_01140 [Chloroflexi bacterium]|nr:hypothetical protein [Chloroflexota bacterium]